MINLMMWTLITLLASVMLLIKWTNEDEADNARHIYEEDLLIAEEIGKRAMSKQEAPIAQYIVQAQEKQESAFFDIPQTRVHHYNKLKQEKLELYPISKQIEVNEVHIVA